jgi:hypothetical protein
MVPNCGHRDQDPLRKLAKRSKKLPVKDLENNVVDCIRSLDFGLLWRFIPKIRETLLLQVPSDC